MEYNMKSFIELGIIILLVALAMSFLALQFIKTLRGKHSNCCSCSGGAAKKHGKPCPHCREAEKT